MTDAMTKTTKNVTMAGSYRVPSPSSGTDRSLRPIADMFDVKDLPAFGEQTDYLRNGSLEIVGVER